MENYEKKYKEALGWMQSLYDGLHGATKEDAEHYFPELKETEDERMKKAIIAYISQDQHFGVSNTDILAWLEKQGEQKHIDYNEELKKCRENPLYFFVKYVSIKLKEQLPTWCKEDEKIRKEIIDFLELPHPQFVGKRDHEKWITWLEKQGEKKPTNEIEPKFKVGDWIVFNGLILHIDEIVNGYYRTTSIGDGIHNSYDWDIDNAARLWTIEDAKNGDVLIRETGEPFIYNGNRGSYIPEFLGAYCGISDGRFRSNGSPYYWGRPTCPATKEQCDMLFQKIKEAGYEWDAENKKLKTIEPKPLNADKVIEWLDENFRVSSFDNTKIITHFSSMFDILDSFRKAMKGGEE